MKCLVINVASATARMAFMAEQLQSRGLSFERLDAVTPHDVPQFADAYDWNSWERPLKETEKACFLSHVAAWQAVVAHDAPMLVLEDDALLSVGLAGVLAALETMAGLEHVTLEVRKRKKIVGRTGLVLGHAHRLLPLYQDRSGAAAYVVWPSGARKLLARTRSQVALADALICKSYEIKSLQVEPACAVQLDRASAYHIETAVETVSMIDAGAPVRAARSGYGFKLRRVAAQFRMGLRALRYATVSERREIALNPADFHNG